MKQIIFRTIMVLTLLAIPLLTSSAPALAACPTSTSSKDQVLQGVGQTGSNCSDTGVSSTIHSAVKLLSYIAGVAAVIMIIIAGIRYTTSNGDSGRVNSAKNALIYALVGIAVAALAQVLVNTVLANAKV